MTWKITAYEIVLELPPIDVTVTVGEAAVRNDGVVTFGVEVTMLVSVEDNVVIPKIEVDDDVAVKISVWHSEMAPPTRLA